MAIPVDMTFRIYTDSGLTTEFSYTILQQFRTDLSNSVQVYGPFFYGAVPQGIEPDGARKLYAMSNPGIDDILLTPTDILPRWQATTAYILGKVVQPVSETGFRYVVTTAGTTSGTEPTWPTLTGSTVTDGSVVWTFKGATHEPGELKIATSEAGLATAVAGDPLNLGPELLSGVPNAVEFWIQWTNAVTVPSNTIATPEISLRPNPIGEFD